VNDVNFQQTLQQEVLESSKILFRRGWGNYDALPDPWGYSLPIPNLLDASFGVLTLGASLHAFGVSGSMLAMCPLKLFLAPAPAC